MFRATLRIACSTVAALVVFFGVSGAANAHSDPGLEARKDALNSRIENASEKTGETGKVKRRLSQWNNWSNWPNWDNWANWSNW